MNTAGLLSIFLALAGMLATLVTLIVAGLIAIFQIIGKQVPKRSLNTILPMWVQITFVVYTSLLLIISLMSAWLLATEHNFITANVGVNGFVSGPMFSLVLILCTLVSYGIFLFILFECRILFDDFKYIEIYLKKFSSKQLADYLFSQHSNAPYNYNYSVTAYIADCSSDKLREIVKADDMAKYEKEINDYDARIRSVIDTKDPLADLFQYSLRSNASDDINIVMSKIEIKLVEFIEASEDLRYLDGYMQKIVSSMMASSSGQPSLTMKSAYIDMIVDITKALIIKKEYLSAANIASQVHTITRNDKSDFLRLYSVKALAEITDSYNASTDEITNCHKYMEYYEKFILIVARMVENYYHNLDNLTPVAIVEENHNENDGFDSAMVNYLIPSHPLYERFDGIFSVIYFDAIDLSAEAFAGAVARSGVLDHNIGASRYSFGSVISSLYYVFYDYAKNGIEKKHYEIVYYCVLRLIRGIEFMYDHELEDAVESIGSNLYSVGVMLASLPDNTTFNGASYKSKRELVEEIANVLNEHIFDMDGFHKRKSSMDHNLFDYINKKGSKEFVQSIDWARDDISSNTDLFSIKY